MTRPSHLTGRSRGHSCVSPSIRSLLTPTLESRLGNSAHGVRSAVFFSRTKAAPSLSPLHLYTEHTHTLCSSTGADIISHNIITFPHDTPVHRSPLVIPNQARAGLCSWVPACAHTHVHTHRTQPLIEAGNHQGLSIRFWLSTSQRISG